MSRVLYFDCSSGVSGDMILGALVDLGLRLEDLRQALAGLPLQGYRIEAREVRRAGIRATKVDVIVEGTETRGGAPSGHGHEHNHPHGHGHEHQSHPQRQERRGLGEIEGLLKQSSLAAPVREAVVRQFRRLAEVEAASHGTSPDQVHFHEVGALDSIVDIVGGVWGLNALDVRRFVSSPLNLGSGTVVMAHGTFPVPAPATARLLEGAPVYSEGQGELTTPTGALLVSGHVAAYGPLPPMTIDRVGYGAGSRESAGRPNVLRLFLGQEQESAVPGERVLVVECELDDMSPQLCGPLLERLLAAGALDAYFTPIYMKKGRPGLLVTVLVDAPRLAAIEDVLFAETTTLGVRRQEWQRTCLEREMVSVETAYGAIRIKRARRGGRLYHAQPEFADCENAARERGVPVKEVWAAALAADRAAHGGWGER